MSVDEIFEGVAAITLIAIGVAAFIFFWSAVAFGAFELLKALL